MLRYNTLQEPYWHCLIANITYSPIYHLSGYYSVKRYSHIEITHRYNRYGMLIAIMVLSDPVISFHTTTTSTPHYSTTPTPFNKFRPQFTISRLCGCEGRTISVTRMLLSMFNAVPGGWMGCAWFQNPRIWTVWFRIYGLSHRAWYYRIGWNCVLWASLGWRR